MPETLIKVDLTKSAYENDMVHNRWHPDIPMVAWVKPGDDFIIETYDWTGGFIKNNDSADDVRDIDLSIVHFLSGPIGVKGAEPGDLLVVDLLDVGPVKESLWGFNGFFSKQNGGGFLTDHFPGLSVWNGRDLLRIASVLQYLHLPNGKVLETSGSAVVFGSMIRSILKDGPIATAASLIAVLIIVAFTIRPARIALMVLATLALGVLWMVGSAGWGHVRVTFLNFIALPITFGIGAEYALNVLTRYREDRNIVQAVLSTGAAVALCSWTTIVGYGSLLAARNQALNGFGWMAILGEIACLMAAIIALPAVLLWWRKRAARRNGDRRVGDRVAGLARG